MSIQKQLKAKFGIELDTMIERFNQKKKDTFDYDNSALPAWGDNTMPDFVTDLIEDSSFLSSLTLEEGVKGYRDIALLNADITLQAKAGCVTSPDGSVVFTETRLTTVLLQAGIEFCNEDLNGKITQILNVLGQKKQNGQLPADLETILIAYLTRVISKKAQNLVLNGDTLSGNAELALMDGLVKIMDASATMAVYTTPITAATGFTAANGYDIAKGLYKTVNPEVLDAGIAIKMYMGRTEALTVLEQWNTANPYSQKEVDSSTTNMMFDLPLMGIQIETLPQLNGTDKAYVIPLSLAFLGTDEMSDMDLEIKYDAYNDKLKAEASFRLGTTIVWDKYFTRLEFTP
tara:strand:- start:1656 stop:2693 length:1038 start_codon:yes stop_codon:yes gene_type:complete